MFYVNTSVLRTCKECNNSLRFVNMLCGLRKWIVALILVCTIAACYHFSHEPPAVSDSEEYLFSAVNMLENNMLYSGNLHESIDYRLYSKRTLGYPICLIFQDINTVAIFLFQLGLVFLNFFLGLFILLKLGAHSAAFKIYCLFYCLSPVVYLHSFLVLADLLLMTFVCVIVLLLLESKLRRKKDVLVFSLLWGLALAIKPAILPSLFVLPLVWYFLIANRKHGSSFLVIPVIIWFTIGAINYSNSEQFETSSISTINLTQYNAKLTISNKYGYDSAQKYVENKVLIIPKTAEQYNRYKTDVNSLGINTIRDNFGTYLKVHFVGIFKMLLDPGRFEIYTFFGESTSTLSLTELLFEGDWLRVLDHLKKRPFLLTLFSLLLVVNLIKLLGLVGVLRKFNVQYLILIGIIGYFLLITGPVGAARFFLPATPLFLVLAAVGWSNFLQKSSKR